MLKTFIEMDNWAASKTILEVTTTNPKELNISFNNVVRFRFFQQTIAIIQGEELRSDKKNFSNWYYVGRKLTINEVKSLYPNSTELISRMKKSHCDAVLIKEETLLMLSSDDCVFNVN